ncbi:uncharacterized protein H6S33_001777 [Morchella sextelata]|uniref:uncharacterized protein n=1 Tax=Morchella sextelata TaxID=1174677 RepID=UPI001D049F43|nr:uncharacterized protein H6S33_001777 [Morchella sextelata]KAH0608643.1 hypothetical protein H6S33_001777 [Morchella sextelata]
MSRTNPPNSFFATKALSLRSNALSGRSSPSSSLHSAPGGVATFISSRNHRPPPFQQRRHPTDPGSSDEPDESGGVGVGVGVGIGTTPHYRRYESDEEEEDDDEDTSSSVPPAPEEDETYDDTRSRASTPRQRPSFPQAQTQAQRAVRIPDFQQMFGARDEDDVFDDKTPSFDDTVASQQPQPPGGGGRMEHMRLPVPMGDAPAPWGKREGSEEVVEIKPEAFLTQQQLQQQQQQGRSGFEKVTNTEMRLEVAAYDDDEEEEVRGGHGGHGKRAPPPVASESEYRHETEDSYAAKQGREEDDEEEDEYYMNENDYTDEDGSDYDERELQRKAGPGLWSDASPTMSTSRGWSRSGTSRSKGSPENVPPQRKSEELRYSGGGGGGKGKGKSRERERKDQNYGAQRLDFRPPKPTVLPLAVRRPVSDPALDLQLSPRTRNLSIQSAVINTEIAVIPERKSKSKSKDEQPRRMITTSTTDIDLHNLLPPTELSTIRTFPDLLTHLSTLRSKSHTTIPATQLPGEIDELARSYYPHDPRVPERFFNSLDDRQHAAAGEYILGRKREMEKQLEGVVAKRRRVVEGMVAEVAAVAEVRVGKLGRTEERREVLKGGVGRMLREAGLWL